MLLHVNHWGFMGFGNDNVHIEKFFECAAYPRSASAVVQSNLNITSSRVSSWIGECSDSKTVAMKPGSIRAMCWHIDHL